MTPEVRDSKHLVRLIARVSTGDKDAFAELLPVLDEKPAVWRQFGDLAAHAQAAQIDVGIAKEAAWRELVRLADGVDPCPRRGRSSGYSGSRR